VALMVFAMRLEVVRFRAREALRAGAATWPSAEDSFLDIYAGYPVCPGYRNDVMDTGKGMERS
jgi:hypothetical protein